MKTTEMKLVPVTPTEEMLKAGGFESESCWANMIAAAPNCEQQEPAAKSNEKVLQAMRGLMGAVNAYEKATKIGGWYAEEIQTWVNSLATHLGMRNQFGLGAEWPVSEPPAEQQQETAEWLTGCPECGMDGGCGCDSGTWNPPNREWQGLTDEEMKNALVSVDAETKRLPPGFRDFARAIEASLKEKNFRGGTL